VTVSAIEQAYERLRGAVSHTPLQYDRFLSEKYQATVLLKREDLQKVRSFKLRGAYYAITQADPELTRRGVVCASAGNHAQGVAYTCQEQQIRAVIFMPTTTPQQKIAQVLFFGGDYVKIELVGDTFDAAAQAAKHFAKEQQMAFIAPFDDPNIIAGQGTVAVEMLADAEKKQVTIDLVVAAIGGGGLISGTAAYLKEKQIRELSLLPPLTIQTTVLPLICSLIRSKAEGPPRCKPPLIIKDQWHWSILKPLWMVQRSNKSELKPMPMPNATWINW